MSKPGTKSSARPQVNEVHKEWEVEAKVSVIGLKVTSLPFPFTENGVISEHRFFYDKDDEYLFSITDNRKMKQKTEPVDLTIDGIRILIRREKITSVPQQLPANAGFRIVTRKRYSGRYGDCLMTCDQLECGAYSLVQLEAEYMATIRTADNLVGALDSVAKTMRDLLNQLSPSVLVNYQSPEKYIWAKEVSPLLPTQREHKGWIQRLFG